MRVLPELDEDNTLVSDPIDVDPGGAGLDFDLDFGD